MSSVQIALAAEVERLRAELAALVNLRAEADSAWDSATYNAERARKAEAELAACREDAERYRWLKKVGNYDSAYQYAIDAAMAGGEK